MSSPLRMRLTLWYVGAFSVVLVLFSGGVYFFVERILRERLDANLRLTLQMTGSALANRVANAMSHSGPDLAKQVGNSSLTEAMEDPRVPGQVSAVLNADGRMLAKRPAASSLTFRLPALPFRASPSPQFYELPESNSEADDSCRGIYQLASTSSGTPLTIVVTDSMEPLRDQLDALQNVLAVAIVLALLLTGSGGWLLARHSLSPLTAMALATERITANNLEERLPVGPRDELGRLASRFNDLLSRLSASFSQQRQFMTDASHELRTPLSIVRTVAQVALQKRERSDAEYREALGVIEKQAGRLSRIVEDMFALTRADMNQLPLELGEHYLDEVVADTMRAAGVLAQRKGIHLKLQDMQEAPYRGDERMLRQMISNLLDNAIKFTPEGGKVDVGLCQVGANYEITVTDTGCGIPNELQHHVFERFFRADNTRVSMNGLGGAGLGLAIARSIAELHYGQLTLQHSGPEGTTFCISLPVYEHATGQVETEKPSTGSAVPFL
jgi:two-component system OmpR family sensor kinase